MPAASVTLFRFVGVTSNWHFQKLGQLLGVRPASPPSCMVQRLRRNSSSSIFMTRRHSWGRALRGVYNPDLHSPSMFSRVVVSASAIPLPQQSSTDCTAVSEKLRLNRRFPAVIFLFVKRELPLQKQQPKPNKGDGRPSIRCEVRHEDENEIQVTGTDSSHNGQLSSACCISKNREIPNQKRHY